MKKMMSAVLAVVLLMGLLAAIPAFAADLNEGVKTFDGTESTDYDDVDLVVTEVMVNSKSNDDRYNDLPVDEQSDSKFHSYDCFDYIEIYNRGDKEVNLYDYSLLRAKYHGVDNPYLADGKFTHKNNIVPGSIYSEGVSASLKKHDVINPSSTNYDANKPASEQLHWLKPGEFAVIWFWTSQCDTVSSANSKSMASANTNVSATSNAHYFPQFREHYNVSDDTIVLAVYAQNNATNAKYNFDLVAGSAYMYAIADRNFQIDTPAVEGAGAANPSLNAGIESMFCWGTGTRAGIPTTDNTDHQATNYMPPNVAPDLYNADNKGVDKNWDETKYFDYVQTGHSISYKEMAVFRFAEEPTVGSMPMYQWAYVDPEGLMTHWDALHDRAEAELEEVIRAAAYEEIKAEITTEVNNDETIMGFNKPGVIKDRLDAADDEGGLVDQRTAAYMADSAKKDAFLRAHYADLLRLYVCDYDEVINYKVYETDGEGNVVLDDEKNPVETDEFLLLNADGELLTNVENGWRVWVSRLISRAVEKMACVLADVPDRAEVLIEIRLVPREKLEQDHFSPEYNGRSASFVIEATQENPVLIVLIFLTGAVMISLCVGIGVMLYKRRSARS